MTVAIFDLDRTLIDVNSGHLWLRHEWKRGRIGVGGVMRGIGWFTRYALGESDLTRALDEAARVYRGVSLAEVEADVASWFQHHLAGRARPGALDTLRHHHDAGHTLLLATSSSQFIGRLAGACWGFDDVIATEVEHDGATLDGTIRTPGFGHHKLDRCRAWVEAREGSLADVTFYTDSYSDRPLLDAVGHPVVVHPDARLRRYARMRGWPILDWGTAPAAA